VLIPQTVNGKPLTKKSLGDLAKKHFSNTKEGYRYIWPELVKEQNDKPIDKSHWVLMTKDLIQGSRNQSYSKQQTIVSDLAKKTLTTYEVPESLEAAVSILSKYASSGKRLFSINPWTYARCQDKGQVYQIIVGGFHSFGLDVSHDCSDNVSIGVAALRKF